MPSLVRVWDALEQVRDPEMPTVSIVTLGMVEAVRETPDGVAVDLLPTFLGCPALELIRARVVAAVQAATGLNPAAIRVQYRRDVPWTSDRLRPEALPGLREMGIAPPANVGSGAGVIRCPYCGSSDTREDNRFGSTACRSLFYCRACRNPFEAMKTV
jgi:ring-1,2-phenylacetyl-CoA epoxidase subunit PaaD